MLFDGREQTSACTVHVRRHTYNKQEMGGEREREIMDSRELERAASKETRERGSSRTREGATNS
jgi:hypothetical protein